MKIAELFAAHLPEGGCAALAKRLHSHAPAQRTDEGVWIVNGWSLARTLLTDRVRIRKCPEQALAAMPEGPFREHNGHTLAFMDPPSHTRVRRALAQYFTVGAIATLEQQIDRMAHDLVAEIPANQPVDLVEHLAAALPLKVICRILGAPEEDAALMQSVASRVTRGLEPTASPEDLAAASRAIEEIEALLAARLRRDKRTQDVGEGSDLFAVLSRLSAEERLSRSEMVHQAIFLLNAGHETTTKLIAAGLRRLMSAPEWMVRLKGEPNTADGFIEETLRLEPALQLTFRRAVADIETPVGTIANGEPIFILIAAANRDPEVFTDPDRFDPLRAEAARHLSFIAGPHACLGANLARREGVAALRAVAERFSSLHPEGAPQRVNGPVFAGLTGLPGRCESHSLPATEGAVS